MKAKTKNSWIFEEKETIKNELINVVSEEIIEKVENSEECLLIKKRITYSDLTNSVKYCGKTTESIPSKYINLYLTLDEIVENGIKFGAKQSNITVDNRFFAFYGIERLKRRNGKIHKELLHKHEKINETVPVYFYNDYSGEFETEKTIELLTKLKKTTEKVGAVKFEKTHLIPIEVSQAIHGLGTKEDALFHEIRKNTFLNDAFYFLCLTSELIIIPKRNAKFYSVLGQISPLRAQYISLKEEKAITLSEKQEALNYKISTEDEIDRRFQAEWRNALAEEMMNYSSKEGMVMCPLTGIEVDFDKVGTLFRASHIKGFADCLDDEKYDINNGLLIVASADALFDKHLFTINEDGKIINSFYLESQLTYKLGFTQNLFYPLLNSKRIEYLKYHKKKFEEKERER